MLWFGIPILSNPLTISPRIHTKVLSEWLHWSWPPSTSPGPTGAHNIEEGQRPMTSRYRPTMTSEQFFPPECSPQRKAARQGCPKNHPTNFSQWNADDFSRKGKSIVRKDWPKHVNHVGMASHTIGSVQMVFASLRTGSKCAIYTGLERYFFHVCCRQFWRWVMGMR